MRIVTLIAALSLCTVAGAMAGQVGPDPNDRASTLDPPIAVTTPATPAVASVAEPDWNIELLFSADVVNDSVLACAIFRSTDGAVGLMQPAQIIKRLDDSTVVGIRRGDVLSRCFDTLKRNGVTLTTRQLRTVDRWSGEFRPMRLPIGARIRA